VIAAYAYQTGQLEGMYSQKPIAYENKYEYIDIPPARHSGYKNENFEPWLNSKFLQDTDNESSFFMT
jgi:hypothetical protein